MSELAASGLSNDDSTSGLLAGWDLEDDPCRSAFGLHDPGDPQEQDQGTCPTKAHPVAFADALQSEDSLAFLEGFSLGRDDGSDHSRRSRSRSGPDGPTVLRRDRPAWESAAISWGYDPADSSTGRPAGRPRSSQALPGAGDVLAGFRIVRELGRGAFARVYLAEEVSLGRRLVAIKVSRAEGDEPRILARLQHTNIVPVHSASDDPETGLRVLCMPFFGGANLAQVLDAAGGLSSAERAGRSLVEALDRISRHFPSGTPVEGEFSRGPVTGRSHAEAGLRPLSASGNPAVIGSAATSSGSAPVSGFRSLLGRIVGHGPLVFVGPSSPPLDDDPHQPALQFFRKATAVQAAVWIVARLAEGLDHAHSRGLLHRDLKPANILLAADGTPMLLDFNLAAEVRPQSIDGAIGRAMIGGTLPYMAPEHLAAFHTRRPGAAAAVDERADIYAMGLILFEVIAGEHPLPTPAHQPGTSPLETIERMIEDRRGAPSLRARCPDVPWSLDSLVKHCLEFEPDRRYARARDLAEDLRRFLDDLPMKHCPEPSPRERAAKFARRHPVLCSATSIALCSLVLILGLGTAAVAAVGGMQGLLARLQRQAFERDFIEAQFLLNAAGPSDHHLTAGLAKARCLYERLQLDERGPHLAAGWFSRLTVDERRRVREQVVELMILESRARVRLASRRGTPSDRQDALRRAVEQLDLAERLGDHVPSALFDQRARYFSDLGEAAFAERDRGLAARILPTTCHDWTLLGTSLLADGHPRAAEDALRQALRLDCTAFWAWFMMGHCHYAQGRFLEAAGDFSACTAQGSQFSWVHFNRGLAMARAGLLDAARDAYDLALRADPTFAEAMANRAMVNLELDQLESALDDLTRAIALGRDDVAVLAARGEALARLGRLDEAQLQFQALLADDPHNAAVLVARAMTRLRTDPPGARADFEHVLTRDPHHAPASYGMALLVRADDPRRALGHLDTAIAADPHLADAIQLRALVRARLGDPAALDDVDRLLKRPTALRYYNAACAVALYSDKAHDSRQLGHAMELLTRAVDLGFSAAEAVDDPDLAPLRSLSAFRRLAAGRRPAAGRAG